MYNSVLSNVRRGEHRYDKKSVTKEGLKTHKEDDEIYTRTKTGLVPTKDSSHQTRYVEGTLPYYLELNKMNMVKAARGEMDATKAQREILQSYMMSQEVGNRMKAGSCLRDNHDRGAIIRDIQQQHETGCSDINNCRKDGMGTGKGLESRKPQTDMTQDFGDDYHTKTKSSQALVENPRSRRLGADFDDKTFTNFTDTEGWNRR